METKRLLHVFDTHLSDGREYTLKDYGVSIADFCIYPWLSA
jgi:hypothetical protein